MTTKSSNSNSTRKYFSAEARRRNWYGGHWITALKRLAIYLRDNFTCQYCHTNLHNAKPRDITLDHIVPLDQYLLLHDTADGFNEADNLVCACKKCNAAKGGRTLEDFMKGNLGRMLIIYVQASLEPNFKLARSLLGLNSTNTQKERKNGKQEAA